MGKQGFAWDDAEAQSPFLCFGACPVWKIKS
jgi:hypothetical protein